MMAQCVFHLDDTAVFILYLLFGLKYIYPYFILFYLKLGLTDYL